MGSLVETEKYVNIRIVQSLHGRRDECKASVATLIEVGSLC